MVRYGVGEGVDHASAHVVGSLVVVAVLGRSQEPPAQQLMARIVGIQRVAQLGHGGLAFVEDDRLDRRQRVDGVCRAFGQHAVGAVARAAGGHVAARGDGAVDQRAEQRHGRDRAALIDPFDHPHHRPADHRIDLGGEGLPDLLKRGECARIAGVQAILPAVDARTAAVERPFQAEHQAQPLEAEVGAAGDDHFPAAVVGVVAGIGCGDADALQRRDERLVVEDRRHPAAVLEHLAGPPDQFIRRVPMEAHGHQRVGHLVAS